MIFFGSSQRLIFLCVPICHSSTRLLSIARLWSWFMSRWASGLQCHIWRNGCGRFRAWRSAVAAGIWHPSARPQRQFSHGGRMLCVSIDRYSFICFHFGTLYTGFGICLYFEKWRWTVMLQFSFLRTHSHSNDFGFEAASTWLISKYSSQRLQWPSFIWIHYGFSDNWLQHVKPGTWGTPLNLLLEPCAQDDSDANNDVTLGCMSLETKQRKKGRPL